jgi:hypothetical protein
MFTLPRGYKTIKAQIKMKDLLSTIPDERLVNILNKFLNRHVQKKTHPQVYFLAIYFYIDTVYDKNFNPKPKPTITSKYALKNWLNTQLKHPHESQFLRIYMVLFDLVYTIEKEK